MSIIFFDLVTIILQFQATHFFYKQRFFQLSLSVA